MLLALILWLIMASAMIISYFEVLKEMPNDDRKIMALILFLIFGPIMLANSVICALFDVLLPEGWDDDNDRIV